MSKRCLLHISKLEAFKAWLEANGHQHRPGKGDWQVIQVLTPDNGWQVVFSRADMAEHYSINEKLVPLVQGFIGANKGGVK